MSNPKFVLVYEQGGELSHIIYDDVLTMEEGIGTLRKGKVKKFLVISIKAVIRSGIGSTSVNLNIQTCIPKISSETTYTVKVDKVKALQEE